MEKWDKGKRKAGGNGSGVKRCGGVDCYFGSECGAAVLQVFAFVAEAFPGTHLGRIKGFSNLEV